VNPSKFWQEFTNMANLSASTDPRDRITQVVMDRGSNGMYVTRQENDRFGSQIELCKRPQQRARE
jgi:hypothetical protein